MMRCALMGGKRAVAKRRGIALYGRRGKAKWLNQLFAASVTTCRWPCKAANSVSR